MSTRERRQAKRRIKDRTYKKARKKADDKARQALLESAAFQPAPLSGERVQALIESGAAVSTHDPDTGEGSLTMNANKAWEIDPWLWTVGDLTDQHKRLGKHAPIAIYVCRDYQVSIFTVPNPGGGWPAMWHLSIKRRDRGPMDQDRWRILQHVKNTLVGESHEAVELYPAESRLVDTANQYHLWCFKDPEQQWPFGFTERFVTSVETHGSKQRPLPEGTVETDPDLFLGGMDALHEAP